MMWIVFYRSIAIASLQISVEPVAVVEETDYLLVEHFQMLAFWALAVAWYCVV